MTMSGPNSVMKDELHPEHLVDDTLSPEAPGPWQQTFQAIKNLFLPVHKELITYLRQPTPQKVTKSFIVDASGNIGNGLSNPNPVTLYTCPVSAEAWVNRITITALTYGPSHPLTTGEIVVLGSTAGETIIFLPQNGVVAPVQIVEGKHSAPHLNVGETMGVVGDGLPAGITIRVDLQLILVIGVSEFTPSWNNGDTNEWNS